MDPRNKGKRDSRCFERKAYGTSNSSQEPCMKMKSSKDKYSRSNDSGKTCDSCISCYSSGNLLWIEAGTVV